jgi:DNA-binding transcriptional ArsR family regulator
VQALKSAAEPTRLRLLFLLSQAEYTVGELATVLNQSQPRISRHLRLLTEAGFLDRFREQQCVYYRASNNGRYLAWLRQVLAMADPDAPMLRRDRERAVKVVGDRARVAAQLLAAVETPASGGRQCRWLALATAADAPEWSRLLLEELGPAPVGELLDIGTGSG